MSFDTVIRSGRWLDGTGAASAIRNIGIRRAQTTAPSSVQPMPAAV